MTDRLPEALERVVNELSKLPTIGRKSAQRLAFHLLKSSDEQVLSLAQSLEQMKRRIRFCRRCFFISEDDLCSVCSDPRRSPSQICVVEEPMDVVAFERAGSYQGFYHVLQGHLSPLHGITPDDLRINELMQRLENAPTDTEIILATNPNVDGDATALYLSRLIEPKGYRVTRLGLGLAIGSSLEYSDELTLRKAFEGRRTV